MTRTPHRNSTQSSSTKIRHIVRYTPKKGWLVPLVTGTLLVVIAKPGFWPERGHLDAPESNQADAATDYSRGRLSVLEPLPLESVPEVKPSPQTIRIGRNLAAQQLAQQPAQPQLGQPQVSQPQLARPQGLSKPRLETAESPLQTATFLTNAEGIPTLRVSRGLYGAGRPLAAVSSLPVPENPLSPVPAPPVPLPNVPAPQAQTPHPSRAAVQSLTALLLPPQDLTERSAHSPSSAARVPAPRETLGMPNQRGVAPVVTSSLPLRATRSASREEQTPIQPGVGAAGARVAGATMLQRPSSAILGQPGFSRMHLTEVETIERGLPSAEIDADTDIETVAPLTPASRVLEPGSRPAENTPLKPMTTPNQIQVIQFVVTGSAGFNPEDLAAIALNAALAPQASVAQEDLCQITGPVLLNEPILMTTNQLKRATHAVEHCYIQAKRSDSRAFVAEAELNIAEDGTVEINIIEPRPQVIEEARLAPRQGETP